MPSKVRAKDAEKAPADRRAVAYLRTSSATNVGEDKDSDKRQRAAIQAHATQAGLTLAQEFYDASVRGADRLDQRKGFSEMLAWCAESGVRTIIVESACRFARDLIVQETGHALLRAQGFALVAADSPNSFLDDTPTANLIRQILGAVAEFEKAALVAKLKGARDRASAIAGHRIEGQKGYAETNPEMVREAKRLARKSPRNGAARSLREIARELAALGFTTANGAEFSPSQVQRLVGRSPLRAGG
jgi:DNA invertase Pin-like site-specific DNA recombinase